jgi:hypothetical protein
LIWKKLDLGFGFGFLDYFWVWIWTLGFPSKSNPKTQFFWAQTSWGALKLKI